MTQPTRTPRQRATELLGKHWAGYPIDPWIIADREGVQVRPAWHLPEGVSGVIARENTSSPLIMLVNAHDPQRKQRFTVAHELGHYTQLKEQGGLSCRLGFVEDHEDLSILHATEDAEVDANQFAAELLMPVSALEVWYYGGTSFTAVQHVLDVPAQVLRERYTSLGMKVK